MPQPKHNAASVQDVSCTASDISILHRPFYPTGKPRRVRISLMQIHPDGRPENRTCSISEAEQYRGTPDVYFALNAFTWRRRTENLAELTCLFVDVDYYNAGLTYHEALQAIKWDYVLTDRIPEPSIIVDSGRGLWLIYLLHPTPKDALPLWQAIENYLVETLKPLGADPTAKDVTRVTRLPGSINSKSGTLVHWEILNREPYRLDQLRRYLPEIKPKKPKRKNRASKSTISTHPKLFSLYTLQGAIIEDLKRLADIRGRSLRGHRDYFLFIWCNCLTQMGYSPESSRYEIRNTAMDYLGNDPLTDREWVQKPKSIRKAKDGCNGVGYKLSTRWIIENLDITQEEQKQMQTLISQKEKYRRNNERRHNQNREQYLSQFDDKRQRAMDVIKQNPGATVRELARLADCSIRLVSNLKQSAIAAKGPDVPPPESERQPNELRGPTIDKHPKLAQESKPPKPTPLSRNITLDNGTNEKKQWWQYPYPAPDIPDESWKSWERFLAH